MPDNRDDVPPFLLAEEIRSALRYEVEQDELEAEALRQRELDVIEAAERDAEAVAEAAAEAFRQAEPPVGLDADVDGLPTQRARLIRYHAWLKALEHELAQLLEGRENFLRAQQV